MYISSILMLRYIHTHTDTQLLDKRGKKYQNIINILITCQKTFERQLFFQAKFSCVCCILSSHLIIELMMCVWVSEAKNFKDKINIFKYRRGLGPSAKIEPNHFYDLILMEIFEVLMCVYVCMCVCLLYEKKKLIIMHWRVIRVKVVSCQIIFDIMNFLMKTFFIFDKNWVDLHLVP